MIDSLTQAGLIRFSTKNVLGMKYEYKASKQLQSIEHKPMFLGSKNKEKSIYRRREARLHQRARENGWLTLWSDNFPLLRRPNCLLKLGSEIPLISHTMLSCVQLCSPMDWSPPESSAHGIFQARILEWGTISYSRGSSWPQGSNPHLSDLLHWQAGSLPLLPPGKPTV